jgi:hypothetical protein
VLLMYGPELQRDNASSKICNLHHDSFCTMRNLLFCMTVKLVLWHCGKATVGGQSP